MDIPKLNTNGRYRRSPLVPMLAVCFVLLASCGSSGADSGAAEGDDDRAGGISLDLDAPDLAKSISIAVSELDGWELDNDGTAARLTSLNGGDCFDQRADANGLERPRAAGADGGSYKAPFGTEYLSVGVRISLQNIENYFAETQKVLAECDGQANGAVAQRVDFEEFGDETLAWEFGRGPTIGALLVWVRQDDILLSIRYVGDAVNTLLVEDLLQTMVERIPDDYVPGSYPVLEIQPPQTDSPDDDDADVGVEAGGVVTDSGAEPVAATLGPPSWFREIDGLIGVDGCCIGFLPDGRLVGLIGDGGQTTLGVVDPASPGDVQEFTGHGREPIEDLAVLSDGRVVSVADHGSVLVWDPDDVNVAPVSFTGHDRDKVISVTELPDGRIASTSRNETWVWQPDDPQAGPLALELCCIGYSNDVPERTIVALPDGRVAATAGREIGVFDLSQPGTEPLLLSARTGAAAAMTTLADGDIVAFAAEGQAIAVWDLDNLGAEPRMVPFEDVGVSAIERLPDGRIAVLGYGGRVWVIDLDDPASQPLLWGGQDEVNGINILAVAPSGEVLTGTRTELIIWDPADLWVTYEYGRRLIDDRPLAVFDDGRVVAPILRDFGDGMLGTWNPLVPGEEAQIYGEADLAARVTALTIVDDETVVVGFRDGSVSIYSLESDTVVAEYTGHENEVIALALLPDRRVVSVAAFPAEVHVWDPGSPGAAPIVQQAPGAQAIEVLVDGRILIGGRNVSLWDPDGPSDNLLTIIDVSALAFATLRDGRAVIIDDTETVTFFDPESLTVTPGPWLGPVDPVFEALGLADGRVLISPGNGDLHIWDLDSGRLTRLGGHRRVATNMHQLPNGQVVSQARGGTLLVWDPARLP